MKTLSALFAVFACACGLRAALPQSDLIAQIHFAGAQKISAATNATAFTNEFCSEEALALRAQTADKLSGWLAGWLQINLGVTVAGGPAKLRPLFDDLQKSEWFLEARRAPSGAPPERQGRSGHCHQTGRATRPALAGESQAVFPGGEFQIQRRLDDF